MTSNRLQSQMLYRFILLCLFLLININIYSVVIYVVNSESRTLSRIDTDTNQVQNAFASLGLVPNKVIAAANYLWSVNSGDNAIQKINQQTGSTIANILIESGCNPWDACYEAGYLYVTGLFTNKVYKVNTQTNAVEGYVAVGNAPEALCVYNGKLYVTNTGGYQNNYANSSVSVIDLSSFEVVNTIPVSANPQYIVEKDGMLHVSCTGNWIDTFGKVCIVSPVTETVVQTLDIGGSLNSIWVKNTEQAFVADGNGINLYQYNPETSSIINGATNPITPGGSVVWGNENLVALLCPNWGSTGKLRVLHPDLSFWNEYALGMAPTDMKFEQTNTQSSDETNVPTLSVTVYPNPVLQGQDLTFSFGKAINGTIRLYNTKGQLVASKPFNSDKAGVSSSDLISHLSDGIYFYAVEAGKTRTTGKVIIIR